MNGVGYMYYVRICIYDIHIDDIYKPEYLIKTDELDNRGLILVELILLLFINIINISEL